MSNSGAFSHTTRDDRFGQYRSKERDGIEPISVDKFFGLLKSLWANQKKEKKTNPRHTQERRTPPNKLLRTEHIVLYLNICVEHNYLPRLITVASRIYADTYWSDSVYNIGTNNLYQSRLIIVSSETKGYTHSLCLRRAHATSDTPNNNSGHITPQQPVHSHRRIHREKHTHNTHPSLSYDYPS